MELERALEIMNSLRLQTINETNTEYFSELTDNNNNKNVSVEHEAKKKHLISFS